MKRVALFLAIAAVCCIINAQVPQGFNYQAIARGSDSKELIKANLLVKISVLSDTTGFYLSGTGHYIWEEQQSVTTNSFGLFSLTVGDKSATFIQGDAVTFSAIDWTKTPLYIGTKINYQGSWKTMGSAQLWTVPYSMIAGDLGGSVNNLEVVGDDITSDEALFEVKRKDGQTMFAVYNHGVRVYMPLDTLSKARKGGFAIGGFSKAKGTIQDYFVVNPDSIRAYIDTNPIKARKGGFAVGGFDKTKGGNEEYLLVTRDSTRIYINDTGTKSRKGGFAVGGFDKTKGGNASFLDVATDASGIINPGQNRILWYPLKNAFLAGRVRIGTPDSVGVNSFATGYESKARGMYSQAMGFKAIANGDYSTAIGKNALANNNNSFALGENAIANNSQTYAFGNSTHADALGSFAFGYNAKTTGQDAFAFGSGTEAVGEGSFAIGFIGRDSAGNSTGNTKAEAQWAVAIGMGAQAKKTGAFSIGIKTIASGPYSLALGYKTVADYYYSTAMGFETTASGLLSTAMGFQSVASGQLATTMGNNTRSSGYTSTAMGDRTIASGEGSTALGGYSEASGFFSVAMGYNTKAIGEISTALGYLTTSVGLQSTTIGRYTKAIGNASFALGSYTEAIGDASTALGDHTKSTGRNSTAMGQGTIARSVNSLVIGTYNDSIASSSPTSWQETDPLFIIGNGTIDYARRNAFIVYRNGNAYCQGNLGIGTATPDYKLTVNGTAWCTSGSWTGSDIKWKENIRKLNNALSDILKLNTVLYDFRTDEFPEMGFETGSHIGLIAQEVEKVFPLLVKTDNKGYKAVAYDKLSAVLVEAIKEQQNQIESYKSQLQSLQEKVEQIEALLARGGVK